MDDATTELTERFERYCDTKDRELPADVLAELQSMLRLYAISAEELDFKWQAYSIKMGAEGERMELKTVRDFKKTIQDTLERESRGKAQQRAEIKKERPTPRAKGGDMYDMIEGLVPNTPRANGSAAKRKNNFDTPNGRPSKAHLLSSPAHASPASQTFDFAARANAGDITEQFMSSDLALPDPPAQPAEHPTAPRMKLKANTDMSKFAYRTMTMKLSEASEVLDDRIDEFRQLLQDALHLDDSAFGNPSLPSPNEIVAVGRIASDTGEGKLNTASLVLEGSRRFGSGRRVSLQVSALSSYTFFPGQIVALRGTNASGDLFVASELLSLPLLNPPATKPDELDAIHARYLDTPDSDPDSVRPLTMLVAAGPYTTDASLDFAALHTLLDNAAAACADTLVLLGPFLDAEHPLIRTGDFDLPDTTNPDHATLTDVFRHLVGGPIREFVERVPTCNVILVPSLRDAHHHSPAFPQDKFVKRDLGLGAQGKMVQCVTNPMTLTMNEITVGMSSVDVLSMLRQEELVGGTAKGTNLYERGARNLLQQRSFLPVFPPTDRTKSIRPVDVEAKLIKPDDDTSAEYQEDHPSPFLPIGTPLDTSYLKLADTLNVRPDILITPSALQGTVKVRLLSCNTLFLLEYWLIIKKKRSSSPSS